MGFNAVEQTLHIALLVAKQTPVPLEISELCTTFACCLRRSFLFLVDISIRALFADFGCEKYFCSGKQDVIFYWYILLAILERKCVHMPY